MRGAVLGVAFGFAVGAAISAPAFAREASMKLPHAHVEPLTFAGLKGWADDDHAAAFAAFRKSCNAIVNGGTPSRAGRPMYSGLYRVCSQAAELDALDGGKARQFFETNFTPMRISRAGEPDGFFTGYYETEAEGSPVKTAEFSIPIYRRPANLIMGHRKHAPAMMRVGKKLVRFHDRASIEDGALAGRGLEICWLKDPVDAFFAQIQGSMRVRLTGGKVLRLNYAAHNGFPYTPVGRWLIDQGIVTREDISMDRIREWMGANPKEGEALRRTNRSYVFFRDTELAPHSPIEGAQGVHLTPLRSLAVDKSIHVYGTPIWIDAELPIKSEKPDTPFRRLLIAQDTGSAIVGPARADIFFGSGEEIGHVAGRIKQHGQFVMLVPKTVKLVGDSPAGPSPRQVEASTAQPAR
jgi:membrane-bound lytic murein transglycosylase A